MNIIIWLIVGGLVGWVASLIMRTNAQQGILLNIVVGIVGAFLGGWLLSPLFGIGTINNGVLSVGTFLVSLGGAVILLAIPAVFLQLGMTLVLASAGNSLGALAVELGLLGAAWSARTSRSTIRTRPWRATFASWCASA